jgi:hypothetical protein
VKAARLKLKDMVTEEQERWRKLVERVQETQKVSPCNAMVAIVVIS